MDWIQLAAAFFSGVLGAMGLGGGGVLIIYLTLYAGIAQHTAQGLNLLLFVPLAALAVFIYTRKGLIAWKAVLVAAVFGIIGAIGGVWVGSVLDTLLLKRIFGGLLAFIGVRELFAGTKKLKK